MAQTALACLRDTFEFASPSTVPAYGLSGIVTVEIVQEGEPAVSSGEGKVRRKAVLTTNSNEPSVTRIPVGELFTRTSTKV